MTNTLTELTEAQKQAVRDVYLRDQVDLTPVYAISVKRGNEDDSYPLSLMLKAARAVLALPPAAVDETMFANCNGEQKHFERWAIAQHYDMRAHPLHYVFLDPKTYAARQAWNGALEYVRAALKSTRPASEGGEEAAYAREVMLQEVLDGAYGDNPMVRGLARDKLAALRAKGDE